MTEMTEMTDAPDNPCILFRFLYELRLIKKEEFDF